MTVAQAIALLPLIVTATVAIFSLWSQQRQERWRSEQQRKWTVDDRNVNRSWGANDRQIEQKKSYLQEHKQQIDSYIRLELSHISTSLVVDDPDPSIAGDVNQFSAEALQLLQLSTEAIYHAHTIGDKTLKATLELINSSDKIGENPAGSEEFHEEAKRSRVEKVVIASRLARVMENEIIEQLQKSEWK